MVRTAIARSSPGLLQRAVSVLVVRRLASPVRFRPELLRRAVRVLDVSLMPSTVRR